MHIALANVPPWNHLTPPLHIGYLSAYLRKKGHKINVFDFNIEAYQRAGEIGKYLWSRDLDGRWIKDKSLSYIWFGKYFSGVRSDLMKNNIPTHCSERCCAMQATEHRPFREMLISLYKNEN